MYMANNLTPSIYQNQNPVKRLAYNKSSIEKFNTEKNALKALLQTVPRISSLHT